MKLCGLTGGVGMGKSTTARFIRERRVAVVDTDEIAREMVRPGQPALSEIQKAFGNAVIAPDGQLRRDELAKIVFADESARRKLEAVLHPRIRSHWLEQVEIWRHEDRCLAVVVIPLLFETQAESNFDKIICTACSSSSQNERLLARGWTPDQIRQRIASQLPVEQKVAQSDFVIWTEGELENHARQLDRIIAGMK